MVGLTGAPSVVAYDINEPVVNWGLQCAGPSVNSLCFTGDGVGNHAGVNLHSARVTIDDPLAPAVYPGILEGGFRRGGRAGELQEHLVERGLPQRGLRDGHAGAPQRLQHRQQRILAVVGGAGQPPGALVDADREDAVDALGTRGGHQLGLGRRPAVEVGVGVDHW